MMLNRIIYLCGSDGSGKTTLLEDVEDTLKERGLKTYHVWLRSPKIFSKPLMVYCRFTGLTNYVIIDGVKYGQHNFEKSKVISVVYPLLQLADFKIKWFFVRKKFNEEDVILFDRFALDTLVDLMVSTKRLDLHRSWVGRQFISMVPSNSNVFVVEVLESSIRKRKKDTLHDPSLALKIKAYTLLAKFIGCRVLDNNRDYALVKNDLLNTIDLNK